MMAMTTSNSMRVKPRFFNRVIVTTSFKEKKTAGGQVNSDTLSNGDCPNDPQTTELRSTINRTDNYRTGSSKILSTAQALNSPNIVTISLHCQEDYVADRVFSANLLFLQRNHSRRPPLGDGTCDVAAVRRLEGRMSWRNMPTDC
jgi:hypothetical protein